MARAPPWASGGWNWGGGRGPQWAPPRVSRGSGPAGQQGRLQPVLSALPTWACSLAPGWRLAAGSYGNLRPPSSCAGGPGRPPSPHSWLPLGITAPRPSARPPERAADLEMQPGPLGPTASWNEASGKATRPGQSQPPPGSRAHSSDPHSWHLPATLRSGFLWANLTPCRASQWPLAPRGRGVWVSREGAARAGGRQAVCAGTVLGSGLRG